MEFLAGELETPSSFILNEITIQYLDLMKQSGCFFNLPTCSPTSQTISDLLLLPVSGELSCKSIDNSALLSGANFFYSPFEVSDNDIILTALNKS